MRLPSKRDRLEHLYALAILARGITQRERKFVLVSTADAAAAA
jgi:hypothetical protein